LALDRPARRAQFITDTAKAAPNDYFRAQGLGEVLYRPVFDIIGPPWRASDQDLAEFRKIVTAAAEGGWQISEHTMIEAKFERLLDMFEDINRTTDITGLRWSFHHGYAMTDQQMVRAKALGMVLGLHTTSTLLGTRWLQATGGSVLEMPPFRSAQESGIPWGLGTDAGIPGVLHALLCGDWQGPGGADDSEGSNGDARRGAHRSHPLQRLSPVSGRQPRHPRGWQVRRPCRP
jgi:hypothetical protein